MTWTNLYHVSLTFKYSVPNDHARIQIIKANEATSKLKEDLPRDHVDETVESGTFEADKFDTSLAQKELSKTLPKIFPELRTQRPTEVPDSKQQILILSPAEEIHEHESCGHQGYNKIRARHGMPVLPTEQLRKCAACQKWNQKAARINRKKSKTKKVCKTVTRVFQRISIDKAYMPVATWDEEPWFQVIVDFLSRKVWQQRLKFKSNDFPAFQSFYNHRKAEKPDAMLYEIECDNEYNKSNFIEMGKQEGFVMVPQSATTGKAWIAERMILQLRWVTMPQLETAGANIKDWGFSMDHAEELINDSSTACLPKNATRNDVWLTGDRSEEFWAKNKGSVSQKKHRNERWGCFAALSIFNNNKSQPGTVDCMFLGLNKYVKNKFVVRVLSTGRITSSINVSFNSEIMPCRSKDFSQFMSLLHQKWNPVTPVYAEGGSTFESTSEQLSWEKPT